MLLPTQATGGCLRLPAHVSPRSALNMLGLKEQIVEFESTDHGLVQVQRNEQAPSLYSWVGPLLATLWPPASLTRRPSDQGATSGLDRARTEATLEWWQGQARQYQQTGDRYLRSLFVAGALSVIRYGQDPRTKHRPWLTALLARRPTKVAAIALAISSPEWPGRYGQGRALQDPVALAA